MSNPTDPLQEENFAALFEASEKNSTERRAEAFVEGDQVSGRVISISGESVFVDLGGKSEGVLDTAQVLDADGNVTIKVGETLTAHVVDTGGGSGVVTLRCRLGRGAEARGELQLAFEAGIPVEGTVMAVNEGGFDVQVAGVRAFCPVSQMDLRFVEDPKVFIGQQFEFRITRFQDSGRGEPNIVVSRRDLLQEQAEMESALTRTKLEVGAVFRGTVRTIRDFGAFVDIGGLEGMLHISELGYFRVEHPSEVLSVDQEVEVQVIKIETTDDPRRPERIGLSLKALAKDPWAAAVAKFPVGSSVVGRVTRVEAYGAFVEITRGIEGLVHISEMGGGAHVSNPRKIVTEEQEVRVSVLSVDPGTRRISLSMDAAGRAARAAEEQEAIKEFSPASEGFGTFADLLGAGLKGKEPKG